MMGERKEAPGILTLEEMRDELLKRTGGWKEAAGKPAIEVKEVVPEGDTSVNTFPAAAQNNPSEPEKDPEQEPEEKPPDRQEADSGQGGDPKEGESETQRSLTDLHQTQKMVQEDTQSVTEEEKRQKSREKLQKFLNEGSQNIYSHSKSERGPSIFQTGTFSNTHRMTVDDAQAFREMKISDTLVNQYRHFRAQRIKKAADFQLRREESDQTRVRPLYADVPEEEQTEGTPGVDIQPQSQDQLDELEYCSPKDREAVAGYLKKLKRNFGVVTVGLSILTVVSVGWLLLLIFLPSLLPAALLPDRVWTYLTGWTLLFLLASIFSWNILQNGLKGLFTFQANCDTPVSLAVVGGLLQLLLFYFSGSRMTADENVFLLAPVVIECLLVHSIGRFFFARRAMAQFSMLCRNEGEFYAAGILANEELAAAFTRGRIHHRPFVGFQRRADFPSDFMYYTFLEDHSDVVGYFAAPISLCLAFLFFAVSAVLTGDIWVGITLFAAVLSISGSSAFFLGLQTPLLLEQRRMQSYGASLLGYEAAAEFGELNAAMISARKLFPKGTVRLCGMRMFNAHPIDDSILCAASILNASNSVLRDMFLEVLLGREDFLKPVDSVLFEDNLGISGWVDDRHVVIGTREMTINHNIAALSPAEEQKMCPPGTELVYISISGELAAAFIFSLSASEETEKMLTELLMNDIVVVVQTVDPVITAAKLSNIFEIDDGLFKILPARFHKAYRKQVEPVKKTDSPVINRGTFISFATSLIGAKRLKKTVMVTTILSLAGAAVGILFLLLFAAMQQLAFFSSVQILLLNAIVVLLVLAVSVGRKR